MAEAVVGQLLVTLGGALAKEAATYGGALMCKEAAALRGLFGKIRRFKAELESMQAYLREAERFKDIDKTTAIYVGEIRGLAFQIEDVVDEFTYKLEDSKHGGFAGKMKKRLNHIKTWRRLAAKLKEIEAQLQDANRRRRDYAITNRSASPARLRNQGQALHFTRDEDLVGIEENKERLIRWLADGGDGVEQSSSKVTMVWGMPGVGKTTLVDHVYNTVKLDFDAAAWVTVSESYRIEDLLKKIAAQFGIAVDVTNNEMRGLAKSIHNYLQEDYELKRRKTMRQWITAGFITEKDESKTLEEVAEGYLVELVNRSLLRVVERNHTGRLKCCQMHDVIRLLALNKAKEECFGKGYNGSGGTGAFSVEGARRISVQCGNLEQLSRSCARHLRALHVFERYINVDLLKPIITSSNLLSTLDLQGTNIKMLPNEVFNLFNLRYLGLRNTEVEILPEAVGRLQNLEVLDALESKLMYLPKSIVKLRKLRYLYVCTPATSETVTIGGVKVPNGMQHLAGLRALQSIKATPEFLREVAALTELRTFDACDVRSEHSADLSNAITKMSHLVHLGIAVAEDELLRLEGLNLPPTLSMLTLGGQLEKTKMPQLFSSWSHLNSLTRLHLEFSNIDEQTLSCLFVLRGLCFLYLLKAFEGKRLDFYAGSFPKLRHLLIGYASQLNQVGIEEGAMQNLVELLFRDCPELKFLPDGIEHLAALEKLVLQDTSEELIEKLRQKRDSDECSQDAMKINHIRNVTVVLSHKGLVERIR
ncbi:hypothetical protein D1007_25812 [Hordeum vulgare]|nr:hypothetical protein D1007_25812 [Hordeum vulgare]